MAKQPTLEAEGPVRAAIRKADRYLRKMSGQGDYVRDGPTPERAARANGHMQPGADKVLRVMDSQLAQLESRHKLDPKNPARNRALAAAGERLFEDAYIAGLIPSGAHDPSRVRIDGGRLGNAVLPIARSELHWGNYIAARKALGDFFAPVVIAIVLMDRTPDDAGRALTPYQDAASARAAVLTLLRGALDLLCRHYAGEPTDTKSGADFEREERGRLRAWAMPDARPTIDGE